MTFIRTPGRRSRFRTPFKHACQRLGRSCSSLVITDLLLSNDLAPCEASRLPLRRTRERWQFYPWALNRSRISSGTGFAAITATTDWRRPRVRREHQQPCDCHERFRTPLLTSALFSPSELSIFEVVAGSNCFSLIANNCSRCAVGPRLGVPWLTGADGFEALKTTSRQTHRLSSAFE